MPQDNPRTESDPTRQQRASSSARSEQMRGEQMRAESAAAAETLAARVGDMSADSMNAGLRMQTQMFDTLQSIGRDWMERRASGAEPAMNLPNRMAGVRSIPEAVSTYQEWFNEWMTMCNEDGRRFLADGQKIMATGVRCFINMSPGAAN
jgi:hypothetical protein